MVCDFFTPPWHRAAYQRYRIKFHGLSILREIFLSIGFTTCTTFLILKQNYDTSKFKIKLTIQFLNSII